MNIRYRVDLTAEERQELKQMLSAGKCAARKLKRAQILLAADTGASDEEIERTIGAGGSTVYRTKRRFVECGLEAALSEEPRCGAERKLRQGRSALGRDGLLKAAGRTPSLDAGTSGSRDGQADGSR
jgi:hypothetical protein